LRQDAKRLSAATDEARGSASLAFMKLWFDPTKINNKDEVNKFERYFTILFRFKTAGAGERRHEVGRLFS
jgi:hypothetical protein